MYKAYSTYGIYMPVAFGTWESTNPLENTDYWEKGIKKYFAIHISNEDETQISTEESDFITFHLPFNEGSKPIVDAPKIAKMKKGVGLINCSRGGVISESDLLDALNSGQVAFAGLDVFEKEPPENTAILKHQNLSMSPHIGGSTKEAQNRIGLELAEKVIEYFRK